MPSTTREADLVQRRRISLPPGPAGRWTVIPLVDASATVVAAWIAAIAAAAATVANLLLARSFEEERAIGAAAVMLEKRLDAYANLWALLDAGPKPRSDAERTEQWPIPTPIPGPAASWADICTNPKARGARLREWHYRDGGGLLLSHDAQALWHAVERALERTDADTQADRMAVWSAMSLLRSELKRDLLVRGNESHMTRLGRSLHRSSTAERKQNEDRTALRQAAEPWLCVKTDWWPTDTRGR